MSVINVKVKILDHHTIRYLIGLIIHSMNI